MKTIYYNKQTKKMTQTQSNDTIPMTDELMADYRHYSANLKDKSLELIQEVGQVPYLVRYKLDENDNRYTHYLTTKDESGYLMPDLATIALEVASQEKESFNKDILSQIEVKEKELYRPMRELLSTATTQENKDFAQSKINNLEIEIQSLRSQLR